MEQPPVQGWIQKLKERDPQFAETVLVQREEVLRDGAISAGYKLLMSRMVDAVAAHPQGSTGIADRARAAGAMEEAINEAVRVGYLFGGTPALTAAISAFR